MTKVQNTPTAQKRQKLHLELLKLLVTVLIISIFCFQFIYHMSFSVLDHYAYKTARFASLIDDPTFQMWMRNICIIACSIIFISLFLFLAGQKTFYVLSIIQGVQTLKEQNLDFIIPLEGNDDLTTLAENINSLSASLKEHRRKEEQLQKEKEALTRSLSHDIRTPLTSIISYADILESHTDLKEEQAKEYIRIIQNKAQQIHHLTSQMFQDKAPKRTCVSDGKLLFAQLIDEWSEDLEDTFEVEIHDSSFNNFKGNFALQDLQRIFNNLSSNIQKYACEESPISLTLITETNTLSIIQKNKIKKEIDSNIQSNKIGLQNIKDLARSYGGDTNITQYNGTFEIEITLSVETI